MTRTLLNLIHKSQGFDKAIPILMKVKKKHSDTRIVSVLHLEPRSSKTLDDFLQKELARWSDQIIVVGTCGFAASLSSHALSSSTDFASIPNVPYSELGNPLIALVVIAKTIILHPLSSLRLYLSLRRECTRHTRLLTIHNAGTIAWCRIIIRLVHRRKGFVVGYLKSVHDQGLGLSALNSDGAVEAGDRRRPDERIDWKRIQTLLVPTQSFKALFPAHEENVLVAGYPPFYSEWKHALASRITVDKGQKRGVRILVFTRGPSPNKLPYDQIISDETLQRLLTDIVDVSSEVFGECRVIVKPHPYQHLEPLSKFVNRNQKVEFTFEAPALASGSADVAIATYSSAIIDAAIWEIPLIEYYHPNCAFRRLHPAGSPFSQLGVRLTRTAQELRSTLRSIRLSWDGTHGQVPMRPVVLRNDWMNADELGNNAIQLFQESRTHTRSCSKENSY